jgi:RNA polymerase-binding protein DksA
VERRPKAPQKVSGKSEQETIEALDRTMTADRPVRPAKSPLTKAELKTFREMLLAKRRDLVGDLSGIEAEALRKDRQEASGDLSTLPTHPADVGTDNYEQEFTLGLLESERLLLEKIDAALERIDEGIFGVCLHGDEPIGKPRLLARPWTRYCIKCARMLEKGLIKPKPKREVEPIEPTEDQEGEDWE